MGKKPFDKVNLQGSQILFIPTVLPLLDSPPRGHVWLSPEGAWKGDTRTQIQLPPIPCTVN